MNKKYFFLILLLNQCIYATKPSVYINLPALLGNRLWGFCVAKIIAEKLGYDLYCKPILGFPNTYSYQPTYPENEYEWENHECVHDINIPEITNNKTPRNIKINGYFQKYDLIEAHAEIIKKDWLTIDPAIKHTVDDDDIVLHIRIHETQAPLKFEFYEQALAMAKYKQLYICTNEPSHPFIQEFAKYNPVIHSTRPFHCYLHGNASWDDLCTMNIDDFGFIASFKKIIISYSTYAWWAAYLSDATQIYAPYSSIGHTHYGKVNDPRWTYIDTEITIY
jgi:hypothetical protein